MKCKICGTNSESEFCFRHKPKKQLQQSGFKPTLSSKKILNVGKSQQKTKDKTEEMHNFFLNLWNKCDKKSQISGTYLGKEPSSAFFHHILPKSKYPEARLDPENIIILTIDEHNNVENDIYKYEIINNKRTILKKKYGIV